MKYTNPVLSGMYPDPSVCCVDGVYYLVNSTFEYMPGIPVFRSTDLVNWKQIGNCLTDPAAVGLEECPCSGGIFAVTIRWHENKFYIITTCFGKQGMKNFFLTAERAEGPWSSPTFVDIQGIDPSLYWEDGRTYVQYTSRGIIQQVEIQEENGTILDGPCTLTTGCGGRDAEGPHIWKREGQYYLLLAEGGTREGHMVTLMRSRSLWGPFEPSPYLPVVSNKDYSRQPLQCVGHADWVTDSQGKDYLIALGTRQIKHKTLLGRETVLTPAYWTEDGWLRACTPFMPMQAETAFDGEQKSRNGFSLDMDMKTGRFLSAEGSSKEQQPGTLPMEIISPRKRHDESVKFQNGCMMVTGNGHALDEEADSVFLALRQADFKFLFEAEVAAASEPERENKKDCRGKHIEEGKEENTDENKEESISESINENMNEGTDENREAGIAVYADTCHFFSLSVTKRQGIKCVVFRKQVDEMQIETVYPILEKETEAVRMSVRGDETTYHFYFSADGCDETEAGWAYSKHLSNSCTNSPNTGTVVGVYVTGNQTVSFRKYQYSRWEE